MNPDIGTIERQVRPLIAAGRLADAETLVRPLIASGSGPLVLWHLLVDAIRPQGYIAETRAIQVLDFLIDANGDHRSANTCLHR